MKNILNKYTKWELYTKFGLPSLSIIIGTFRLILPEPIRIKISQINFSHYYNLKYVPNYDKKVSKQE